MYTFKHNKTEKDGKRRKVKAIIIFIIFEVVFTLISAPALVFYGPFENIKKLIVGTSWATLNHQYIAKSFLSDQAIERIIGNDFAVDILGEGETIQKLDFEINHDSKIMVQNISSIAFDGKVITIYDPTLIKIGYSRFIPKYGEPTSHIAKNNSAVAAINAGGFLDSEAEGWTGTGGIPDGYIIHEGKVIYNLYNDENVKIDTVSFTNEGMLIVGKYSINELLKLGVIEGVSFGPPLIINGKPTIPEGSDGGWGAAPRTVIGQKANGEIIMMVIDGRKISKWGATLKDCQDILLQMGAVNASNLDGGSSATMYYNGKVINKPADALGERAVPSVFLVMPE
ncbi:MAG: phosphodiester glycosidase family protein [Eubacteriales bacterium]|nr:phosphodiester glycosidase family protein [Eubacteriales bacterium]